MPLLQSGRNAFSALAVTTGTGSGLAKGYNSTNCQLVIGNSSAAHATNQTWMQGANSTMSSMNATFPTLATNLVTAQATFTTAMANFTVFEWGLWNATSTGDANANLLNRAIDTGLGTKTSAASWQITAALTITT